MRFARRLLRRLVQLVVLLLILAIMAVVVMGAITTQRGWPTTGTLTLKSLHRPVTVQRGRSGIGHERPVIPADRGHERPRRGADHITTGQSGNPFDPYYGDLIGLWATGDTIPLPFSPGNVAASAVKTLTLTP